MERIIGIERSSFVSMLERFFTKRNLKIMFWVVVLIIIYNIVLGITRLGEIKISVEVIPGDAKIFVNDKGVGKTVYLSPGRYVFSASKDGWEDYSIEIDVDKENTEVGLIPSPASDDAYSYIYANTDMQLRREQIGAINAAIVGDRYQEENPLVDLLPYDDLVEHFTVDYGKSDRGQYSYFILISGSPDGRRNALEWIRDQGVDPTDLEIRYEDYDNPLSEDL